MKTSEILRAAKAKIENPLCWTQKAYARDIDGYQTYNLLKAVCFCSLGAIQSVTERNTWDKPSVGPTNIMNYLVRVIDDDFKEVVLQEDIAKGYTIPSDGIGYGYVSRYNDRHSHSEVMTMWDRAIELAEAEEKE